MRIILFSSSQKLPRIKFKSTENEPLSHNWVIQSTEWIYRDFIAGEIGCRESPFFISRNKMFFSSNKGRGRKTNNVTFKGEIGMNWLLFVFWNENRLWSDFMRIVFDASGLPFSFHFENGRNVGIFAFTDASFSDCFQ